MTAPALAECVGGGFGGSGSLACNGTLGAINIPSGSGVHLTIFNFGSPGGTFQSGGITLTNSDDSLQIYNDRNTPVSSVTIGSSIEPSDIDLGAGDDRTDFYTYPNTTNIIEHFGDVALGEGNDRLGISGNYNLNGNISAGEGNDQVYIGLNSFGIHIASELSHPTVSGDILLGEGDNIVTVSNNSSLNGDIISESGNDTIIISTASLAGDIVSGAGGDIINVDNADITGNISAGDGADTINITSSSVTGNVDWGAGDDSGTLSLEGTEIGGGLIFGEGQDNFQFISGSVEDIHLGDVNNIDVSPNYLLVDGGVVRNNIYGAEGDDEIELVSGDISGSVISGDGNDVFTWTGGNVAVGFEGGDGSDTSVVTTSNFSDVQLFDGGDDVSTEDGFTDWLQLVGINIALDKDRIRNWEIIEIIDSSGTLSNGELVSGTDPASGIFLLNSQLSSSVPLNLNSNLSVYSLSSLNHAGGVINGSVFNSGSIRWEGQPGKTLTINGNYQGNDGLLIMNSVLGDDSSVTDRLIITGNSEGSTRVSVNNIGGQGDYTIQGIRIIEVEGVSAGTFTKEGRIVAGAFDYSLVRKGNDWYLTNESPVIIDPPPVTPPPVTPPPVKEAVIRPEAGAYATNSAAAGTMFEPRLRYRNGSTYTDIDTGELKYTSLWLHNRAAHSRSKDSSGQLSTQGNTYSTLLGVDLADVSGMAGRLRTGVFAGAGRSSSNTVSGITGYDAHGTVKGYTTGLYATWYQSGSDRSGLWLDSVLQYNWFDNSVSGEGQVSEEYRSRGITASTEAGYVIPVWENALTSVYIQPQGQVQWNNISADKHTENNGTVVNDTGDNNVRTRLGMKVFADTSSTADKGKRNFRPYAEINWVHNTSEYGVKMDDVNVNQRGSRNLAEFGAGLEGQLSRNLNLTGSVSHLQGSDSWSETAATIGIRYSF